MTNLEQLLTKHEKFIYSLIKKHKDVPKYSVFEKEDLKQEAVLAFIEAYENFNPEYGTEFLTYAGTVIKRRLIEFTRKTDSVSMPFMFVEIWNYAHENNLEIKDAKLIAEKLDVPYKRVISALEWDTKRKTKSLNETYMNDTGEVVQRYEKYCIHEDDTTNNVATELMNELDEQTKEVVNLIIDGYTQTEIQDILGIPQYKVSRILKRASKKIEGVM